MKSLTDWFSLLDEDAAEEREIKEGESEICLFYNDQNMIRSKLHTHSTNIAKDIPRDDRVH